MTWSEKLERVAWILGLVATAIALMICGLEARPGTLPLTNVILGLVGSVSCGLVWAAGAILFIVSMLSRPLPRRERYRTLALLIALSVAGMCAVMRGSYLVPQTMVGWQSRHGPSSAGWSFGWAEHEFEEGRYEEAIEDYGEAIRLDPEFAGPYLGRAVAYYERGWYTRAISDCNVALSLSPEYFRAYRTRGLALHAQSDFEGAISDYTAALAINPSYHEIWCDRGRAYASLGEYDEAAADYSEAIRLNPDYV